MRNIVYNLCMSDYDGSVVSRRRCRLSTDIGVGYVNGSEETDCTHSSVGCFFSVRYHLI